jgi:hypothetical protein
VSHLSLQSILKLGFCLSIGLVMLVACQPGTRVATEHVPPVTDSVPDSGSDTARTLVPASADTVATASFLSAEAPPLDPYWNDVARLLAGLPLPTDHRLGAIADYPAYKTHSQFFNRAWAVKDSQLLAKLSTWAQAELPTEHTSTRNVLYPFSGPDFMTVHTLFPNATTYVLFGLEPEGRPVDIRGFTNDQVNTNLTNLRVALDDILLSTFFKTNDMRVDFQRYELKGALPILLAFISRRGNQVLSVRRVKVLATGTLAALEPNDPTPQNPNDSLTTGIEIRFKSDHKPDTPVQTLVYLSFNADDTHFKTNLPVIKLFDKLSPATGYIKSASYLLHNTYFSEVRNKIQAVCATILQDDSGIAYKYWPAAQWKLRFYGRYGDLVPLFRNRYQPEVAKIYQTDTTIKRLTFGLGYTNRLSNCNLMIARKHQ